MRKLVEKTIPIIKKYEEENTKNGYGMGRDISNLQRMETMRKILDISSHVNPLGMVYLGHPVGLSEGRCRYREKAVFYQKHDPNRKLSKNDKPVKGHYS